MPVTALQIVERVRELVQVFGTDMQFRNGFSTDTGDTEGVTRILPAVNEYLAQLSKTGFYQRSFDIAIMTGTMQYELDLNVLEILSAYHNNVALVSTNRDALDADVPDWRKTAQGYPQRYMIDGGFFTVHPAPSNAAAGFPLTIWAKAMPPALALEGDTILGLPTAQALRVPYGAALILATIDDNNVAHQARRQQYQAEADKLLVELEGRNDRPDDYGPRSMDQFIEPPTIATSRDKN